MKRCMYLLLLCSLFFVPGAFAGPPAGMENRILRLVNEYRNDHGRDDLQFHSLLNDIARKHSADMARGRRAFGHGGFDGRMQQAMRGIRGTVGFAENVAYGDLTAEEVTRMWINSKGHRKNILGNYNLTGIGIARGRDGELYFTQVFVRTR